MSTELKAGDTITAESLNGIAEGAYTFKSGEILTASKLNTISGKINEQEEEIAELEGQISDLEAEVAEKQAIIDAFPTIEALNVTANGTYSETGKAYSPVNVNVESYSIGHIDPTSIIKIVNNTSFDIHYPDIPKIYAIQPTINDNVDINIITIPAGGENYLTVSDRGFYRKPGKSWRYGLRQLEDLTNNTITASAQSLGSGTVDAYTSGIFLTSPADNAYFNYIVTIS